MRHEFIIELAQGYDTPVGARASRSRCSMKRPPRSTPRASKKWEAALAHLIRGRTTFVIAHRLSTVTKRRAAGEERLLRSTGAPAGAGLGG
jgi:hypothetical protein